MNEFEELREFLSSGINSTVTLTLQSQEVVSGVLLRVTETHFRIRTIEGMRQFRIDKVIEDSVIISDEASSPVVDSIASSQSSSIVPSQPAYIVSQSAPPAMNESPAPLTISDPSSSNGSKTATAIKQASNYQDISISQHVPVISPTNVAAQIQTPASGPALPHVKTASRTCSCVLSRKRRWFRPAAPRLAFSLLISHRNAFFVLIKETEVS
jgi:hypothetical protein